MEVIKRRLTTIGVSDPRPKTYLAKLFHKPKYDLILEVIKERIGDSISIIADAGCGFGALFEWLLKKGVSFNLYIGCDKDRVCLKYSGKDFEKIICDISYLPFIDGSVDMVVCSEVLEHVKNPYIAFKELLRVSREWGLVTFPNEKVKNAIGFRYPEHVSEPSIPILLELAESYGYKMVLHKRLYFIVPPSLLDKAIPYNPKILKFMGMALHTLSSLFRQVCLIKTEILLFQKVKKK